MFAQKRAVLRLARVYVLLLRLLSWYIFALVLNKNSVFGRGDRRTFQTHAANGFAKAAYGRQRQQIQDQLNLRWQQMADLIQ